VTETDRLHVALTTPHGKRCRRRPRKVGGAKVMGFPRAARAAALTARGPRAPPRRRRRSRPRTTRAGSRTGESC